MLNNPSALAASLLACLFLSATAGAAPVQFDAEKIKVALQTATPEEDGFVDRALRMVDEGKIPPKLVQGSLVRARKQERRKFQQFKYGLLAQVSDASIRSELKTGKAPRAAPPSGLRRRIALQLRRLRNALPGLSGGGIF